MKRYFGMSKRINKSAENTSQIDMTFEETSQGSALERLSASLASEETEPRVHEPSIKFAGHHEPNIEAEHVGDYPMSTIRQLHIATLRKRLPVGGGWVIELAEEQGSEAAAANCPRPEVQRMLNKVLDAGGRRIADWLKKQAAKIAAADCTRPEIGELLEAYYVPLLLSALMLDDEEFDVEYPGESQVSLKQRAELAEAIQRHSQNCPRCSLKVASDWAWDEYVDRASANDKYRLQIKV